MHLSPLPPNRWDELETGNWQLAFVPYGAATQRAASTKTAASCRGRSMCA